MLGTNTSVPHPPSAFPSAHGVWLLIDEHEYFLPYEHFPWFADADEQAVADFQCVSPGHYYWPQLDVDLTQEMIEHPEKFPLVAH